MEKPTIETQGIFDIFKLLNKENIEKINKILNSIKVEDLENGSTKISVELSPDVKN